MDLREMGSRIKERRLKMSMSQTRLAELTGYKDKTAISHVESGRIDLPQSKLVLIATILLLYKNKKRPGGFVFALQSVSSSAGGVPSTLMQNRGLKSQIQRHY